MDSAGSIFVWGDVDVTWHYRQSAVDTAGPAKDRSQKQWSGVATYGLSGLNVRQLKDLGNDAWHGLWMREEEPPLTRLSDLEREKKLPIFGYSIGYVPKSRKKGEQAEVLRVKEPYGWTACVWRLYRNLFEDHLTQAMRNFRSVHRDASPAVVLLNDAGWGCLRGYFDNYETDSSDADKAEQTQGLREWLVGKSVPSQDSVILVKSRIYPPVDYVESRKPLANGPSVSHDRDWIFMDYKSRLCDDKRNRLPIDDRLIVMVNVSDLRLLGTNVSRGISWERSVQHLLEAAEAGFPNAGQIVGLLEARYVIVLFSVDGLVLIDRGDPVQPRATLFFHGPDIEGDSERSTIGRAYGTTTWISSLLAHLISQGPESIDEPGWWQDALRACLAFVRKLNQEGNVAVDAEMGDVSFGSGGDGDGGPKYAGWTSVNEKVKDPLRDPRELFGGFADWHQLRRRLRRVRDQRDENRVRREYEDGLADELRQIEKALEDMDIDELVSGQRLHYIEVDASQIRPLPYRGAANESLKRAWYPEHFRETWWSFLSLRLSMRAAFEVGADGSEKLAKATVRFASEVMQYGGWDKNEYYPYALSIPYVEFGKLRSCDRAEIEGLRNFSSIVGEYLRRKEDRPLNVAVFGPPGAGKSFAVRQVIESLSEDQEPVFLTFNLSQFQHPNQLPACYQQIQNEVLKGKLPVVFWDEFDTTLDEVPFGWLHAFLSPMQDGSFIHEQRENKIGQCVFVFAGSRFDRFADLPEPSDSLEKPRLEVIAMSFRDVQERAQVDDLNVTPPFEARRLDRINLERRKEDWRVAKGNDFRSRLKGYLDVQDCNLRANPDETNARTITPNDANTCDQLNFLVRRARMVREYLLDKLPELFVRTAYPKFPLWNKSGGHWISDAASSLRYLELKIGDEIAFGLLSPFPFIHGMRSIEAVLQTSELSGKSRFERAFLQTGEMLSVHIRPDAFDSGGRKSFDDYLGDWWGKYKSAVQVLPRLGEPLVEWKPAWIDGRSFPCLCYDEGILIRNDDDSETATRLPALRSARPDRLEILISDHNDRTRPELWHTIAHDRGSPYVLSAEEFMFYRVGLDEEGDCSKEVYIACRWWRKQECGALSFPVGILLKREDGLASFVWGDRGFRDPRLDEIR